VNLELINEINDLKLANHSATEIAEITGVARTSIVLSIRLSTLFEQSYSQQFSSLENTLDHLQQSIIAKDAEIKRLSAIVKCNESDMVITKKEYDNLKNELVGYSKKVDRLNCQLENEINYLDNLSFIDKLKILFL
jgi:peptidoglycan hydrolase CwlO-like protein